MEANNDIIANAINSFQKYMSKFSDEQIEDDLKKYDSSIYSGQTIGELDNLLFFKGISENFTQKDLITTDHFGLNQFCQTDIGEGIKIKLKIKNNPQTFAGYFF